MKTHMMGHEKIFVCRYNNCHFECYSTEVLDEHKKSHIDMTYAGKIKAKAPSIDPVPPSNDGFSNPFLNGRPIKDKDMPRGPYNNPNYTQTQPSRLNHNYDVPRVSQGALHTSQGASYYPQKGSPNGSNSNPYLPGPDQGPHVANIYMRHLNYETSEAEVKSHLESRLNEMTGKIHKVDVKKLEIRHYHYSAFHISCYCAKSEVFMDPLLWPDSCTFRWYTQRRHKFTPREYTTSHY